MIVYVSGISFFLWKRVQVFSQDARVSRNGFLKTTTALLDVSLSFVLVVYVSLFSLFPFCHVVTIVNILLKLYTKSSLIRDGPLDI